VISIQNEREWSDFCEKLLNDKSIASDPRFSGNANRVIHRAVLDEEINQRFAVYTQQQLVERLDNADIAYGRLNDLQAVLEHPQLQQLTVNSPSGELSLIAAGVQFGDESTPSLPVPAIGEHSVALRKEFTE
jgi:crotonobetainyl-CoA:carnitine CoA-transferase CaiB-like acyl-CoA transferase